MNFSPIRLSEQEIYNYINTSHSIPHLDLNLPVEEEDDEEICSFTFVRNRYLNSKKNSFIPICFSPLYEVKELSFELKTIDNTFLSERIKKCFSTLIVMLSDGNEKEFLGLLNRVEKESEFIQAINSNWSVNDQASRLSENLRMLSRDCGFNLWDAALITGNTNCLEKIEAVMKQTWPV